MTMTTFQAAESTVSTEFTPNFLDDGYWLDRPDLYDWCGERDDYLASIEVNSTSHLIDRHRDFVYDEYLAHAEGKYQRERRRLSTGRATVRRQRVVERLLIASDFDDKTPEWRDRSRLLIDRGRSVRSVLTRTWMDGDDRHDAVCVSWADNEEHVCVYHDELQLGGEWRRIGHKFGQKWYRKTHSRCTVRQAAIREFHVDHMQDLNEADWMQTLHPITLLIVAWLALAYLAPRCTECGVLVEVGARREHRYGHDKSYFGYSGWSTDEQGGHTLQSFNWVVTKPALYYPMMRWESARNWSTHLRKLSVGGRTILWQPRPGMNQSRSRVKSPLATKPGNRNYTII